MRHSAAAPKIRVLHTSPDASVLDVYVDKVLAVPGISYGQLTSYGDIERGNHRLTIVPAHAGLGAREAFDANIVDLSAERSTLVITGLHHRPGARLLDDTTHAPAPGRAKVRVLHVSPDLPRLDVMMRNSSLLTTEVRPGEATSFAELPAGVADLEMRPPHDGQPDLLFPRYTLLDGGIYTFVMLGLFRGTPALNIMPLVEEARIGQPA